MAVAFDYADWARRYPGLAGSVDETVAGPLFDLATSICDNSDQSRVPEPIRGQILYLLVAHLAMLFVPIDGEQPGGIVGRIESATEGSVTVNAGKYAEGLPQSASFYVQTQYGALAWQLLGPYRMARYVPAPPESYGPRYGGGLLGRRFGRWPL